MLRFFLPSRHRNWVTVSQNFVLTKLWPCCKSRDSATVWPITSDDAMFRFVLSYYKRNTWPEPRGANLSRIFLSSTNQSCCAPLACFKLVPLSPAVFFFFLHRSWRTVGNMTSCIDLYRADPKLPVLKYGWRENRLVRAKHILHRGVSFPTCHVVAVRAFTDVTVFRRDAWALQLLSQNSKLGWVSYFAIYPKLRNPKCTFLKLNSFLVSIVALTWRGHWTTSHSLLHALFCFARYEDVTFACYCCCCYHHHYYCDYYYYYGCSQLLQCSLPPPQCGSTNALPRNRKTYHLVHINSWPSFWSLLFRFSLLPVWNVRRCLYKSYQWLTTNCPTHTLLFVDVTIISMEVGVG